MCLQSYLDPGVRGGQIGMMPREKDQTLDFLDDFYEVINDEEKFTKEIMDRCRPVG